MDPVEGGLPEREDMVDAFPALKRLSAGRRRQVPFIQQLQAADCAAACLAMVLAYFGRRERLDTLRDAVKVDRHGTSAQALAIAAERFGLRARGVRLEIEALQHLPAGSILHWEFNHFVVFERLTRRGVELVDPAFGRRFVPLDVMRRSFTGIALIFEPADDFAATPAGRSPVWAYMRQLLGQRKLLGRVVTTSVMLRLFALALPVLTALVVDRVVPRGDRGLLGVVSVGIGAVLGFQLVSRLIRAHLLLQLRTNLDTRLTLGFLDHLVGLPYDFFQRRSTGDLLMRVASNTQIREVLTTTMLSALLDGGLVVLYLGAIVLMSPALAGVALLLGVLQAGVFIASRRHYRELMSQDLESQARAQSYLVQMLAGIETLKVTGAEHRAVGHWSNLYVDQLNVSLARGRLGAITDAVTSTLQLAGPLVLVGYGALQVMGGAMSLGAMLAAISLATAFLQPLSTLVDSAFQLQQLGSYVERIDDVLTTPPEQLAADVALPPRLTGHVELRGVSFRYGPHAPLAVRDVSLVIEPGTTVALVGRSGSGKSTLAALLLGLYKPSEGQIRFDGHDLAHLDLRAVRRQLGIVPQHPFLFGGTVRDNIALADPSVPLDRVIAAARLACIDTDVTALPMRYDSILADGGASLSGGQRQRLALARALLHQPAILLLDEATSALDASTERAVVNNLGGLGCTRVVIAHRLSTIAAADLIVVMDDGRIVETGTHHELLARSGSYAELVAAQTSVPTTGWLT